MLSASLIQLEYASKHWKSTFSYLWDAMGLPFLSLMTGYIQTRLYAVITAAGLTPWTGTDSGVPKGGAEGPFLYLLFTLALAFELARVYPGYAPYPLRSPLINFADDNLLTTATRHLDPENAGLPTTTEQASAILELTTTYLDAHQLLVHPRKSVGLADARTPTPHIQNGELLHLEDTTVHLGVTQPTRHHHITLPSKLEARLARLPQIARGDLLSTQGLAYFMEAVLNAAIRYQALQLPRPQGRPTPRSTATDEGMGATRRLACVFPQGGHDGPLELLRRQYRRPGRHGLCQTRSAPPKQGDTQPPT